MSLIELTTRPHGPRSASLALLAGVLLLLLACGDSPTGSDSSAPPGWGPPEVLAQEAVFDRLVGACLAGDGAGDAIAVWAPSFLSYPPVLARRFSPRDGWMPVETIDRGGDSSASSPTVEMNARSDAVAIWDTYYGLRAATLAAGGAWDAPEVVARPDGFWSWGLDDGGNALLAWALGSIVLTSRFEPGLGWRDLGQLPGPVSSLALAVSGGGHALAAWESAGVSASSFDPQHGWSPPHRLNPEQPSGAYAASAFLDAVGHGIVAWLQPDPSVPGGSVLHASLFDDATGFSAAEALGPTAGTVIAASLGPDGNAFVIYMSGHGLRRQRYLSGEGWQAPEPLEGVGGFDAVVLDDAGNGWVLWNERSPGNPDVVTLLSRRLADGRATGSVEQIAPPFAGFAWFCGTAMDAQGGLNAAWFQRVLEPDVAERYALVAGRYNAGGVAGRPSN